MENHLIANRKIVIIGGGPGGLTLARLLQLKGIAVKVYERDRHKDVRLSGGALDLHTESGLAALDKAGLLDQFKRHYRPDAGIIRVVDQHGQIYYDEHIGGKPGSFGAKEHRPEIDRGPLRAMLLASLQPDTVVWDSQLSGIEKVQDAWRLHFANGQSVVADLVIGADGANSKVRPLVTTIRPVWTGVTMLEGNIEDAARSAPLIHQLLKGGKIFAYGHEKTLILSSKGNGSFGFALSWKSEECWKENCGLDFKDNEGMLRWFKKEFLGWGSIWHTLFESDTTTFIPRPQYCMPLNQQWEAQSNITLIGDAAHCMPPFAGEGVNMAMLDALQLSEVLTNPAFLNTKKAIAHYEQQMFNRCSKVGRGTLFNTEWMHGSKALRYMLAMFGENKLKKGLFMAKMMGYLYLLPFFRKQKYPLFEEDDSQMAKK